MIDAQGRITQFQIADLSPAQFTYDTNGRPASIVQGSGDEARTTVLDYNETGYLKTMTDPLGQQLRYEYDDAARITKERRSDGYEITYGYDGSGNVTSVIPPGRPPHIFHYTSVGLLEEYLAPSVGPGSNSTLFRYSQDRQLAQIVRPDGLTLNYTYDNAGRLGTLETPTGVLHYVYDGVTGKLTRITTPEGNTLSYAYNGALLAQIAWGGQIAGTVSRTFDSNLRTTSIRVNALSPFNFEYDEDSLLKKAGDLVLTRNAQNGLVTGTTLGKVTDSYTYNSFGEVTDYIVSFNGSPIFQVHHEYDKLGRLTSKSETFEGATDTYTYAYDLAGRLQEVKKNSSVQSTYVYDPNGNRTSLTNQGGAVIGTYDDQDRLKQFGDTFYAYTENGDLLSKVTNGQTTTYEYDVLGNLRRVTMPNGDTIEYIVDAHDRRIGKKVNSTLVQRFLYQDKLRPIAEFDGAGILTSLFVYTTRQNVPDYLIKNSSMFRIICDQVGSPRLVINADSGEVVQRMEYDEFGNLTYDSNPGFQPFAFAGGLNDVHTKLIRLGARDYDPQAGRWTVKDTLLFLGMDTNLYAYVNNDPVNRIDPLGLQTGGYSNPAEAARQAYLETVFGGNYDSDSGYEYVGWIYKKGGKFYFTPAEKIPLDPKTKRVKYLPKKPKCGAIIGMFHTHPEDGLLGFSEFDKDAQKKLKLQWLFVYARNDMTNGASLMFQGRSKGGGRPISYPIGYPIP